jgi:cellulose synthase (UDP-forming)
MHNVLTPVCAKARSEVLISSVLLLATLAAFALFFVQNYLNSRGVLTRFIPGTGVERGLYNLIFSVFMYGSLAYQVSRLAFFWNVPKLICAATEDYGRFVASVKADAPRVEILVPCYQEETHVIWQTLMSAALVDYPRRGVVLLLDNPPLPANATERNLLLSARAQVDAIRALFAPIGARFSAAADTFRKAQQNGSNLEPAAIEAARLYDDAADFLEQIAAQVAAGEFGGPDDHTRKFFLNRILREPAQAHRLRARDLRAAPPSFEKLGAEFDRLSIMFDARLSLFERKKYVNLSHAANKAANLNSYISIMGRSLKTVLGPKGLQLVDRTEADKANRASEIIEPADADYIIILDADSFLLPEYATCMISALESHENRRAAVAQTPYTAIPDSPHVLERTASATTDIYYYVTEGMGFLNAGFWVGASATIRKIALIDIACTVDERGYTFPIYIQDKTLIEDTGATIDLIRHGWSIHNYPARLSYSATPADFGALVVQRRRWANGGLILLPDLLRHLVTMRLNLRNVMEAVLRIHYLIMPACMYACMLLMLVYPFDFKRISSWIYLTLPPYLFLVCRDLAYSGYRRTEVLRAYALFLLLLPVVLAGVKNSLRQILFGIKAQFGRTPKIEQRTAIPLTCTAAIVALLGWSLLIFYADIVRGDRMHALFALTNALALGYGVAAMIGLKAICDDVNNAATVLIGAVYRNVRLALGTPAESEPSAAVPALRLLPPEAEVHTPRPSRNSLNGSALRLPENVGGLHHGDIVASANDDARRMN